MMRFWLRLFEQWRRFLTRWMWLGLVERKLQGQGQE